MEVKPSKGLKVHVKAHREAIFGDESVSIQNVEMDNGNNIGTLTGNVLAGFGEVEMGSLDGKKHWYPIEEMTGENGEKVVEEEIPVVMDDGWEGPEEEEQ